MYRRKCKLSNNINSTEIYEIKKQIEELKELVQKINENTS